MTVLVPRPMSRSDRLKSSTKKKQHVTFRTTERISFALELVSALEKKSANGVIETAVERYARDVLKSHGVKFDELFSADECVRKLRLYLDKAFPLDDEDERRRDFVFEHLELFYDEGKGGALVVNVARARVLWPELDRFAAVGEKDYYAPVKLMTKVLEERGVTAPKAKK